MNYSNKIQGSLGRRVISFLCIVITIIICFCDVPHPRAQVKPAVPARSDSALYEYEADRVIDDLAGGRVILEGCAVLRYRGTELRAGWIELDKEAQTLTAEALPDSTGKKRIDPPVLIRGLERFSGTRLVYDLERGRGKVSGGRAAYLGKYYQGENILLDPDRELHARNLSISTCNRDHVHYDFLCRNLKVLEDDKAIGRSVTFRIGPVPIAWLPFFVFPTKKTGRQSGVLTPNVGSNSRDGFFVSNLGYYYAPNDYWDATVRTTFRESGGFLIDTDFAYNVRQRINGATDLSFENRTGSRNWRLNTRHQQRLSPTLNLRGNGSFSSASFEQRNSNDLYRALNRQLRSSLSLDKKWTESGRSLDASTTFYRDLVEKRNSFQGFPRLSFRQGRRPLWGDRDRSSTLPRSWWHSIFYNFSGELDNDFTRGPDDAQDTEDLRLRGRFLLNSQHRAFGIVDVSPSFSTSQQLSRNDQDRSTRRETYTANLSTRTTLYGIFGPHVGRLRGVRHRLQPRVDFRYSQSAAVEGGTFGFGGNRSAGDLRRSLGMGLGNSLEIKTNEDGKEHRATLATMNFSTGYQFDVSVRKWEPLRTMASIKPDRRVDVRLSMTHNFYDDQDRLSILSPRLQNLSVTSNFRFRGIRDTRDTEVDRPPPVSAASPDFGFERDLYEGVGDVTNPWQANLTHYYSISKGASSVTRSWVKVDLGFNPTRAWRINYGINYDIERRDLTAQNLSVYRDLHCWEARFSWYPTGFNSGFYFRINIKGIPQIKLEHRQGGFGV